MHLASSYVPVAMLFAASLVAGQAVSQQDPAALARVEQARAQFTLVQPSTPSFVLQATLRIFDRKGKQLAIGSLEEGSVQDGPWKRTLVVEGKQSSTYFLSGKLLQDGDELSSLYARRAIEMLFSPVPAVDYFSEKVVFHQKTTKAGSVEMNCVIAEIPYDEGKSMSPHDAFCFAGSPAVLRMVDGFDSSQVVLNRILIFGERYVPGDVEVYSDGVLRASLHVDKLNRASLLKGGDMTPPSSAVDTLPVHLDSAVLGTRISGLQPVYPGIAKQQHIQGTVALRAIIGKDGAVRTLEVISTPDESMTTSTLTAVRTWQYKPYLRNGQPVEVETVLKVNYSFGG